MKQELLERWEVEWGKSGMLIPQYGNDFFVTLFKKVYKGVCKNAEKNKNKNEHMKCTAILFGLGGIIAIYNFLFLAIIFAAIASEFRDFLSQSYVIISILLFPIILYVLVVKWIDVKKYQETWVRHREHQLMLEEEMTKYILKLEHYDTENRNSCFVERFMEIEEYNRKKFVHNMENHESDMLSIIDKIRNKEK